MFRTVACDVDAYLRRFKAIEAPGWLRRCAAIARYPILWTLAIHRVAHWYRIKRGRNSGAALRFLIAPTLSVLSWIARIATKTDILATVEIEPGVALSEKGYIILGARRIGRGTCIGERVTIGMSLATGGVPEIGRDVQIGCDTVIYGAITIGDGVVVKPGSVVTRTVPPGITVEGNPARMADRTATGECSSGACCA